jgi:hypothetical protein
MVDIVTPTTMLVTLRAQEGCEAGCGGDCVPAVRQYVISVGCPRCGQIRGRPELQIMFDAECGHYYCVDTWVNPCGHIDRYSDVLLEVGLQTNLTLRRGMARVSPDGRSWMTWSDAGCPDAAEPLSEPQRRLYG